MRRRISSWSGCKDRNGREKKKINRFIWKGNPLTDNSIIFISVVLVSFCFRFESNTTAALPFVYAPKAKTIPRIGWLAVRFFETKSLRRVFFIRHNLPLYIALTATAAYSFCFFHWAVIQSPKAICYLRILTRFISSSSSSSPSRAQRNARAEIVDTTDYRWNVFFFELYVGWNCWCCHGRVRNRTYTHNPIASLMTVGENKK